MRNDWEHEDLEVIRTIVQDNPEASAQEQTRKAMGLVSGRTWKAVANQVSRYRRMLSDK